MVPSYVPLETIQLLSETFLFAGLSFWDILLSKLKWDTLYIYIYIYQIYMSSICNKKLQNSSNYLFKDNKRKRIANEIVIIIVMINRNILHNSRSNPSYFRNARHRFVHKRSNPYKFGKFVFLQQYKKNKRYRRWILTKRIASRKRYFRERMTN